MREVIRIKYDISYNIFILVISNNAIKITKENITQGVKGIKLDFKYCKNL